jgi:hypothetical protein
MGIAQDLDRRYTIEEQAALTFTSVCADCWPGEESRLLSEAGARQKRVVFVGAHAG